MSAEEAAEFTSTVDWTSTLVVPIPRNAAIHEQVTVDGVTGTLIQRPSDDAPTIRTAVGQGWHHLRHQRPGQQFPAGDRDGKFSSIGVYDRCLRSKQNELRKVFGDHAAVKGLTLQVEQGEVFGFLGPNGAGKTTSMKMLLGLIAPTSGRASLLGAPIGDRDDAGPRRLSARTFPLSGMADRR